MIGALFEKDFLLYMFYFVLGTTASAVSLLIKLLDKCYFSPCSENCPKVAIAVKVVM